MATSHYEKKWKYLSIGLMGILATGFLFPQAFAAASLDSVMAVVKDIQAKVTGIKTTVDTNLDAKISSRATPSKIVAGSISSGATTGQFNQVECTSSSDYIVHISVTASGIGGQLNVAPTFLESPTNASYEVKGNSYFEFGSAANQPMKFEVIAYDPLDFMYAYVTIETAQGAIVQCLDS